MTRPPRKTGKKPSPAYDAGKVRVKIRHSREAEEETDPEWRSWFCRIERLRHERADPARRAWVFSSLEKDGVTVTVARRKSEPLALGRFMKKEATLSGRRVSPEREKLETLWAATLGPDIAASTSVFALKNGVLTIAVTSAPLLQEIRQFHHHAIFTDLLESWPFAMPLLRIVYKLARGG